VADLFTVQTLTFKTLYVLLTHRPRPTRGFKRLVSADTLTRGCALVRNLPNGFSSLTARVPRPLRLATAWPQLARAT
jgi:hypothetical protein